MFASKKLALSQGYHKSLSRIIQLFCICDIAEGRICNSSCSILWLLLNSVNLLIVNSVKVGL